MADGFLGRWSRRKLDVRDGKPVAPEPVAPPVTSTRPSGAGVAGPAGAVAAEPASERATSEAVEPRPPTLDDVRALTRESDFSAFTRRGVDPEVRNAAMKKLFTDPHYNVMDGLDIYIDDYSKPDPLPQTMLRQLASARFLHLFDDEKRAEGAAALTPAGATPVTEPASPQDGPAAAPREVADNPTPGPVAQSGPDSPAEVFADRINPEHADPDLRLQQDDAPAGEAARGRAS